MDQLRDRSLARPWLFRILRREALRNLPPAGAPVLDTGDEALDQCAGPDELGPAEQRADILAAMQALPAIHREALTLFYFEDMAVAQMALALDVAPGTVLSRLNRAREALRQRMHAPTRAPAPTAAAPAEASATVLEFPAVAGHGRRDE